MANTYVTKEFVDLVKKLRHFITEKSVMMKRVYKLSQREVDLFWNDFYSRFTDKENTLHYDELFEEMERDRFRSRR